ncbi:MAG: hypothetical protein ACM3U2_21330 [Deltaproteobacteria bacterium]
MRNFSTAWVGITVCLAALLAAVWVAPVPAVHGQDKSKLAKKSAKGGRGKPVANTKSLDVKADQIQTSFTKEAEELAGQYYDAGHLDKAKSLLQAVLAVNPDAPNIRKKLELVNEGLLNSNDVEVEISPSQLWKPSGAVVLPKGALRIRAEGTYRFEASASGVSAAGFPDKDPSEDMVSSVPCGALMGIIIADGKAGKPFLIGDSVEFTPKESGMLLLRLNTPPGNKCSGKIKVTISGSVQADRPPPREKE